MVLKEFRMTDYGPNLSTGDVNSFRRVCSQMKITCSPFGAWNRLYGFITIDSYRRILYQQFFQDMFNDLVDEENWEDYYV
jgi:hypothetical protein